ncbi:hypothetical protein H4R19_003125 [Coemansia spiralis]|nr:hypothetical protein H4R19_003125 [Coemansia spiralis]
MESYHTELPAILKALQGARRPAGGLSSPTVGTTDGALDAHQRPGVWSVPASVGPDLTKPVVLGEIIAQWPAFDELQKVNVLLGLAHMGQGKLHLAAAEAREISQLAKADASSDWVRTLGCLLGDASVSGTTSSLQDLPEPTRSEMEAAVAQLAAALDKSSLCLTVPELGYVSAAVATSIAPAATRNMYGHRPHPRALSRIMALATKKADEQPTPSSSRKQSVAQPSVRRSSTADPGSSASSSRMASPEPVSAGTPGFSGLFGGGASDDDEDRGNDAGGSSDSDADGPATVVPSPYALPMNVKPSHQADHSGRMARLLLAAGNTAALGGQKSDSARPVARGGQAAAGMGMRRPSAGMGPPNKVGMIAPRRRGAPVDIALPGSGPVAGMSARRAASGSIPITHQTKRVQVANLEESAGFVDERERLLKEQREQASEMKEAKRLKQRADAEERKRRREEARQQKQAADEAKRQKRNTPVTRSAPGSESPDEDGGGAAATAEPADDDLAGLDAPSEYKTFRGDTPQIESVYADTNALSNIDRLRMYCFFNARPMPPGTDNLLEITLNEQVKDDPANPGKTCTEIMIFKANLEDCEWKKVRRMRRP